MVTVEEITTQDVSQAENVKKKGNEHFAKGELQLAIETYQVNTFMVFQEVSGSPDLLFSRSRSQGLVGYSQQHCRLLHPIGWLREGRRALYQGIRGFWTFFQYNLFFRATRTIKFTTDEHRLGKSWRSTRRRRRIWKLFWLVHRFQGIRISSRSNLWGNRSDGTWFGSQSPLEVRATVIVQSLPKIRICASYA